MTEQAQQERSTVNPAQLAEMSFSFAPSYILSAAVELDVFTPIAEGKRTTEEIARATVSSERGIAMLLDALSAFQLLEKTGDEYRLSPVASEYLVKSKPSYIGTFLSGTLREAWLNLADIVRTGKPVRRVEEQAEAEKFFSMLVRNLHVMNREPARLMAQALGAGTSHHGLRVVDVACGSGVWGIGIAEADHDARITAQDFPGLFDVTREYLKRHNVEDRYDFLPGDLKEVDFGEEQYDVALLGNIVHSEGERSSRDLFKRLHRALKPGGRIVIMDMIPNDERTGPPFALIFAINMLVNTEEGSTYTLAEYTDWLTEAGFSRIETADIGQHSPIIIGYKA
jgi:ubiquinone/menaquinone biosynthesis C-methylase UbiE